jgi:phage terminase large subunit-like protein
MIGSEKLEITDIQRRILDHCFTPDENEKFRYVTVIISMRKKSGKTTLGAGIGSWAFEEFRDGSEIYCLANDEEQAASRIYEDIGFDQNRKGQRVQSRLIPGSNDTTVKVLASEYRSAAGSRPALTLWDELWGYTSDRSRRLWAEMTPPPTVHSPLRVIVTYAGFEGESDLLWDLYEQNFLNGEVVPELADIVDENGESVCRRNGSVFVYWDTAARMPWQTEEYYAEQMATLRPSDFQRLHLNMWVTSEEEFIPIKYWDAAATLDGQLLHQPDNPYRQFPISIAVDAGWKHDCLAIVGTYYDALENKVGVAFHRVWYPNPDDPLDLSLVIEYIRHVDQFVHINSIVYDPTQLHQIMTTLKKMGYACIEFNPNSTDMYSATMTLYELFKSGGIEVYPNDDMRKHMQFAKVESKGRGIKLVKQHKHSRNKVDLAVALAMACHDALTRSGVDTSSEVVIESPYGDMTEWGHKTALQLEAEKVLPPELQ